MLLSSQKFLSSPQMNVTVDCDERENNRDSLELFDKNLQDFLTHYHTRHVQTNEKEISHLIDLNNGAMPCAHVDG